MAKGVLRRSVGSDITDLVARFVAADTYSAIVELGSNAHDADANNFSVEYEPEEDILRLIDDGDGMSIGDGLESFLRTGDSDKKREPMSPKGRVRIGKKGVAALVLKLLGKSYTLETTRSGIMTRFSESFDQELGEQKEVPYETFSRPDKFNGTIITVSSLKFGDNIGFTIDKLIKYLRWNLPPRKYFNMSVNGKPVIAAPFEKSQQFEIDKTGKTAGDVHMMFYYCNKVTDDAGFHVYVNTRQVHVPDNFGLKDITRSIGRKLIAIIDADGLEDAILSNRQGFQSDHPAYLDLQEIVKKAFYHVRNEVERKLHHKSLIQAATQAQNCIKSVTELLNERFIPVRPPNGFFVHVVPSVQIDAKREELEGVPVKTGAGVLYIPSTGEFYINEDVSLFQITHPFNEEEYRHTLIHALIESLAHETTEALESNVTQFLDLKAGLLGQLYDKKRFSLSTLIENPDTTVTGKLSPHYKYSAPDIIRLTGLTISLVHLYMKAGVFTVNDKKVQGGDIQLVLDQTTGLTPLFQLVIDLIAEGPERYQKYESLTTAFHTHSKGISYIKNFGHQENCYFIQNEFIEPVREMIKQGILDQRKQGNPLEMLDNLRVTTAHAAKLLNVPLPTIARVVDYAKQKGYALETRSDGGLVRFRYATLVKAYHATLAT